MQLHVNRIRAFQGEMLTSPHAQYSFTWRLRAHTRNNSSTAVRRVTCERLTVLGLLSRKNYPDRFVVRTDLLSKKETPASLCVSSPLLFVKGFLLRSCVVAALPLCRPTPPSTEPACTLQRIYRGLTRLRALSSKRRRIRNRKGRIFAASSQEFPCKQPLSPSKNNLGMNEKGSLQKWT